jgi:hypothetical protein
MTREEVMAIFESKIWESWTARERATFTMFMEPEPLLCMPFHVFHRALEEALGRPVMTHEMGLNWEGLKRELLGERPKPTMEEILNLIPKERRIVILRRNQQ